jgi:hypothetical protein
MTTEKKFISPSTLYKGDAEKEARGVWLPIGPYQFLIARAGGHNTEFKKLAAKKFKPYAVAINNETLPEGIALDLLVEVFVETVVLDWKDVGDENGNELPYSKETAKKMLAELPDLMAEIREAASKISNFRSDNLEAAAGN